MFPVTAVTAVEATPLTHGAGADVFGRVCAGNFGAPLRGTGNLSILQQANQRKQTPDSSVYSNGSLHDALSSAALGNNNDTITSESVYTTRTTGCQYLSLPDDKL